MAKREPTTEPIMMPVRLDALAAATFEGSDGLGVWLVVVDVVYRGTHSVKVAVVVKVSETEVVSISQKVLLA